MVAFEEQRRGWDEKPLLREVYREFFEIVREKMVPGESLELGSGIGEFPYAEHSDLPLVSAYAIPRRSKSLDNLILIDVFHHLEEPERFLTEARRVVRDSGRIIILEPYLSLGSLPFYLFHNETLSVTRRAQKFFWPKKWLFFERLVCFRYLFSGGYSHRGYSLKFLPFFRWLDRVLDFPKTLAGRVLIVI